MNIGAQTELKLNFRKYFDLALLLAIFTHLMGFLISPSYKPIPYTPAEEEIQVIEELPEVEIPLPPVEVARPSIPIAAEFTEIEVSEEADPDETIEDTEVNVENPTAARLNYVDPGAGGDFTSFSDPPMEKRMVVPDYPELIRLAGIEGTVVARVYIDERGRVVRVVILESPAPGFNAPVKEALFKSEFYPAKQRDIAVKSQIIVPFEFNLRGH